MVETWVTRSLSYVFNQVMSRYLLLIYFLFYFSKRKVYLMLTLKNSQLNSIFNQITVWILFMYFNINNHVLSNTWFRAMFSKHIYYLQVNGLDLGWNHGWFGPRPIFIAPDLELKPTWNLCVIKGSQINLNNGFDSDSWSRSKIRYVMH